MHGMCVEEMGVGSSLAEVDKGEGAIFALLPARQGMSQRSWRSQRIMESINERKLGTRLIT